MRIPQFPGPVGAEVTKLSAGWLIERAGFGKGYPGEDARGRLSTKHTLALNNAGTRGPVTWWNWPARSGTASSASSASGSNRNP